MRLRNILLVVNDIEASIRFYQELFGIKVITHFEENVILTGGLVLQERKCWEEAIDKEVSFGGHNTELYFEETDMDGFLSKLQESNWEIEYVNETTPDHPWGGRVVRIYDPDRHMIEIGETVMR